MEKAGCGGGFFVPSVNRQEGRQHQHEENFYESEKGICLWILFFTGGRGNSFGGPEERVVFIVGGGEDSGTDSSQGHSEYECATEGHPRHHELCTGRQAGRAQRCHHLFEQDCPAGSAIESVLQRPVLSSLLRGSRG